MDVYFALLVLITVERVAELIAGLAAGHPQVPDSDLGVALVQAPAAHRAAHRHGSQAAAEAVHRDRESGRRGVGPAGLL